MSFDYLPHRTTTPTPVDPAAAPDAIAVSDDTRADPAQVQAARDFIARLNAHRTTQGTTTP